MSEEEWRDSQISGRDKEIGSLKSQLAEEQSYAQAHAMLYTGAVSFCCQEHTEERLFAYLRHNGFPEPPKRDEETD